MSLLVGFGVLLLILSIGIFIMAIGIYNALVALKENIKKAWANIDVILKQRYDEIPQLIQICEQYASYEKGTIDKIMKAREQMVKGRSIKDKADGSNALTASLGGLMAIAEGYPELKANTNFLQIQTRLSDLEERLADRREFFNESVNVFNIRIQQIPDVFFARILNYQSETLFEVTEEQKRSPSLKMNI
jgi:LemA protein